MNEFEIVDVLLDFYDNNLYVEQKKFEKGSSDADYAKKIFAAAAYQSMKEGFIIYRKVGESVTELNPEVDYPYLLELEKFMTSAKSNGISK